METSFYSHSQLFRLHGHLRNSLCFLCFLCVVFLSIILSFLSEFVFFFISSILSPKERQQMIFLKQSLLYLFINLISLKKLLIHSIEAKKKKKKKACIKSFTLHVYNFLQKRKRKVWEKDAWQNIVEPLNYLGKSVINCMQGNNNTLGFFYNIVLIIIIMYTYTSKYLNGLAYFSKKQGYFIFWGYSSPKYNSYFLALY